MWFGWSGKAVPRPDVEMHTTVHKNVTYVVTDLSEEDYQEYYNGFANRVLWRPSISGLIWPNSHGAISPDTCA